MALKTVLRLGAAGAVVALGLLSTSAYACKGATTLFRDDFSEEDPGWGLTEQSQAQIGGGAMKVTVDVGRVNFFAYQGQNFPGGDACVDIVFPTVATKFSQGGLGVWNGKYWNFIYIQPDGQAGVSGLQNGYWVNPVPPRKVDAIKTGLGATNQLRVVWKAPGRKYPGIARSDGASLHQRQAVREVQDAAELRPLDRDLR